MPYTIALYCTVAPSWPSWTLPSPPQSTPSSQSWRNSPQLWTSRKEPGLFDAEITVAAIRENLGVSIDPTEIEHSRQLSDFSISVKLRMSGRDSVWHRMCQAMYRKPKRTGESVPSTYMTFDVTKSRNHILWCVRRLKKDSKSPICAFYTDHRGQISVKVKADGPKIRLMYFTPDKKSTHPVTIFSDYEDFALDGYHPIFYSQRDPSGRNMNAGGGVALWCDSNLTCTRIPDLSIFEPHVFESVFVKIEVTPRKFIVVGNIYIYLNSTPNWLLS